jgi:hypothetical protein
VAGATAIISPSLINTLCSDRRCGVLLELAPLFSLPHDKSGKGAMKREKQRLSIFC